MVNTSVRIAGILLLLLKMLGVGISRRLLQINVENIKKLGQEEVVQEQHVIFSLCGICIEIGLLLF